MYFPIMAAWIIEALLAGPVLATVRWSGYRGLSSEKKTPKISQYSWGKPIRCNHLMVSTGIWIVVGGRQRPLENSVASHESHTTTPEASFDMNAGQESPLEILKVRMGLP